MQKIILTVFSLFLTLQVFAQTEDQQVVKWTFETQKENNSEYLLIMTAEISDGWYVYSMTTEEGGPVPTSIFLNVEDGFMPISAPIEKGDKIEGMDDIFGIKVAKYAKEVKLFQRIKVTGDINAISGYVTFMSCNNEKCLPPTDEAFVFELK